MKEPKKEENIYQKLGREYYKIQDLYFNLSKGLVNFELLNDDQLKNLYIYADDQCNNEKVKRAHESFQYGAIRRLLKENDFEGKEPTEKEIKMHVKPWINEEKKRFLELIKNYIDSKGQKENSEKELIIREKLYWFEKIGGFQLELIEGSTISQTDKQKIISKFIGCDPRAVKGYMNNEDRYIITPTEKDKIDKQFKNILDK